MPDALPDLLRQCFQRQPGDRPANVNTIASRLREVYERAVGKAHGRSKPEAAILLADNLNNKAVNVLAWTGMRTGV